MYEPYFSLHEPPFSQTPDPRFLWLSESHEEGLAALCYGITRRKGFLLLTGDVGAGKTTLLRAALQRVSADEFDVTATAVITNTVEIGCLDLLKLVAAQFGVSAGGESKADYVIGLEAFLRERLRDGLNTVLVIDEAQNLDANVLEQVRLLSNLETDTEKLLQVVLTGQPELRRKLATPGLRQLRQRIAVEHHVDPLRPYEIAPYLRHRIEVAGGRYEQIFAPGAESAFFAFSSGCPRLINLLADRALLSAFAKQLRPVPPALVEAKAKELTAARAEGLSESGDRAD
jgi:general secretion pathway protein A